MFEIWNLWYDGELWSETMQSHWPCVSSINDNLSRCSFNYPEQRQSYSGFTSSSSTDYANLSKDHLDTFIETTLRCFKSSKKHNKLNLFVSNHFWPFLRRLWRKKRLWELVPAQVCILWKIPWTQRLHSEANILVDQFLVDPIRPKMIPFQWVKSLNQLMPWKVGECINATLTNLIY